MLNIFNLCINFEKYKKYLGIYAKSIAKYPRGCYYMSVKMKYKFFGDIKL